VQEQAVRIVESVIEITQSRDRLLIGSSLGRTIFEMLPCREITMYHLLQRRDPVELALSIHVDATGEVFTSETGSSSFPTLTAELSDGIIRCLNEERLVEVPGGGETGIGDFVVYPFFSRRDALGGFLVLRRDRRSEDEEAVVTGLLKIHENFVALLDESQSDRLTGLLNRQTFEDRIMKIIANPFSRPATIRLEPGQVPRRPADETFSYWLALLDIDHFKSVNDTHGHVRGDDVLIALSWIMRKHFRSDDLVFRYGGEEFIVILRAPGRNDTEIALERFRRVIERHEFPVVGRLTVSVGYTQISRYQPPASFLECADRALYHAKRNGRNRICCYESLVGEGEIEPVG
jgi:diguanylate cyclase (GGDEF)-like protein